MKTPEEIKAGLECCSGQNKDTYCTECPYRLEDCDDLSRHALAYIQQLEDHIRDLTKLVPKWVSVEERLPTSEDTSANGLVICVCRGEDNKPIAEEVHAWHVDVVRRMAPCFTHWMPMKQLFSLLSEPPKEG